MMSDEAAKSSSPHIYVLTFSNVIALGKTATLAGNAIRSPKVWALGCSLLLVVGFRRRLPTPNKLIAAWRVLLG